jgi:hypothetical protein
MRTLGLCHSAIAIVTAVAVFAGCDNRASNAIVPAATDGIAARSSADKGIYVVDWSSSSSWLLGYDIKNGQIKSPPCTVKGISYVLSVAVDRQGSLVVPNPTADSITVFAGPDMCGADLGSINDPYGSPYVVASNNAVTGIIAVGHFSGGVISLCKLATLECAATLTNPNMSAIAGIAMANDGDCWASAWDQNVGASVLIYFKRCSGHGKVATGYQVIEYGGLTIDAHGNLLAIDFGGSGNSAVYTYKGCNPHCTLIAGPLWLVSNEDQGSLNKESTIFAAAGTNTGTEINFYSYSPTKITYLYNFNTLHGRFAVATAFNPRSKQ